MLWVQIIISYVASFGIMAMLIYFSSNITRNSTRTKWYECIRPSITPPNYVFPIAWTIIYILIAIALANAFLLPTSQMKWFLLMGFAINLVLNFLWSYAYFGKKAIYASLGIIVMLWISILYILILSHRQHAKKWKAWILLPYLLWVTFAMLLNALSVKKLKVCEYL